MVYLTARTASHLYKSPSSLDLTSNGGHKSLVTGDNGSIKYQSLLYCSPSVKFNSNSSSSNSSGSRYHGSSWTLSTRGHGFNNGGRQYEYSQSKSTLDLTWLGKNLSTVTRKPAVQISSSTLNLKSSKSLFNLRQALQPVPNPHTQQNCLVDRSQIMTLPRNDRARPLTITQPSPSMVAKAKQRASILWLIAKSTDNGRIPAELRDPFYRDHNGHESLKPWITQRLANGELYGRALANIYGVPDYSCLGHQGILQLLTRRGIYVQEMGNCDEPITETLLLKTSPVKMNAHMIIIECILTLYVREILIPVKVGEVVSRFTGDFDSFDPASSEHDLPPSSEPEDVALFWVNRACAQLNQEIARDYMNQDDVSQIDPDEPCPVVPSLDELSDMCDGCSLFGLLAFYCPTQLDWREIILKQDISIADSIYNLQRVQYFTAEHFPSDVCFLTLEDFLYLPEPLVPNFLAFIADLLFLFEIQPVECVTAPYLRLFPEGYGDEYQPNYPQLPTPSEMKARSLKHQSWNNDSLEMSPGESAFYNHPSTHQLYNDRRSSYKSGSNAALNQSSRRNSLTTNNNNGSRILHRRSSIMSNGSESHPQAERSMNAPEMEEAYANGGRHQHFHGDGDSENGMAGDSGGQLSSYFSTLSISNNRTSGGGSSGGPSALNIPDQEYYKNRNRAPSSGHLTDYFSNLTAAGTPSQPESSYTANRLNTHVRAKVAHPNNADNVKSLLAHEMHQHHHSAFASTANVDSSQTTSSETSSIAELSEYSDLVRAQLNEKRKQIELERQHEREKRASVDQNFRQEVLRTLKGIHPNDDSNSDIDASENGVKMMDTVNNNSAAVDDENLTFEIHELNPIRREKTFTSLASSKSLNNSSTYMRKNLFSASEDLKASMTDLNYSNAKDGSEKHKSDAESYSPLKNFTTTNHSAETLSTEEKNYKSPTLEPVISATTAQQSQSAVPAPSDSNDAVLSPVSGQTAPSMSSPGATANSTPRRSQWGQPVVPLGGLYPGQQSAAIPSTWSQAGGPYADWYGGQATAYPPPPHHHLPPHPGAYPYLYGMPPGTASPMTRPPYAVHMEPTQYGVPPYATSEQYMSIGYMSQQNAQTPPNAASTAAPGSTYSPSPVLNSSQMPPFSQHQMGSATFRVQKNNGSFSDHSNTHHQHPPTSEFSNLPNHLNSLPHSNSSSLAASNNAEEGGQNAEAAAAAATTTTAAEATTPSTEKHNEAFFISFTDERPAVNRNKQAVSKAPKAKIDLLSPEKQPLTRTATQTLVSRAPQESGTPNQEENAASSKPVKSQKDPELVKKLYEVKRPVATPGVAFVVCADEPDEASPEKVYTDAEQDAGQELDDEGRPRPVTEEDMTRKKELIMKQSLRRRIEQEEKRSQKEQELAAKREAERIRREQSERKKEDEKAKRAFILEQYKQRKQIEEEIEKNGGPLPVSRSSSTLVLNRQTPQASSVNMRPSRLMSAGGRPRPKSLHSTLIGLDGNPIPNSGPQSGRLSSSRDEIDLVGRMSNASRPQSALSSQLNSTVTTPTHSGPFGEAFGEAFALNSTGPTSNTFYEYNGPKLFVKPSQKSNKTLILNAINVVLAGAVNADTNRRVAEVINSCDSKYYLILFRNSGLQYRAIYSYYPERDEVTKLDGIGPRSVNNDMIEKFYKYNSGTKAFTAIQTKHLCVTIDAFTIHNHFWMTKKQQQQQQNTPRRFI